MEQGSALDGPAVERSKLLIQRRKAAGHTKKRGDDCAGAE
jgi:hypothetical protein